MNSKEFLKKVAYIAKSNIQDDNDYVYKSIYDNSYITRVGMEEDVSFLANREITKKLKHGTGFSPKDGKWYGWSHRAIFGFTIGSTCKKGDCHYRASTLKDQEEAAIRFWEDEYSINTWCDGVIKENKNSYFNIKWKYSNDVPNEKLRGTIGGTLHLIEKLGKGEWVAKSMSDAEQMAKDFNEGVS